LELAIRAILSGLLVATISLIARKSPGLGGLIASIPLVSTLGMIWLWRDTGDPKLVADYVYSAFWYFLPSIPMFLLIPWMLRSGHGFWLTLSAGIALTFILYLLTIGIAARFGVRL
jgi:hypothetical protein